MANFDVLQNRFTAGELDPRFIAQADYPNYRNGARKLRNVIVTPQGGCTRRFGSTYADIAVDRTNADEPITDRNRVAAWGYNFNAIENYLIIFRADTTDVVAIDIYLNGLLQTTVPAPAGTYTQADIKSIRIARGSDRILILLNSVAPHQLVRTSATSWAISPVVFTYPPTYDYSIIDGVSYTAPGFTFTPVRPAPLPIVLVDITASSAIFTANHVGGLFYGGVAVVRILRVDSSTRIRGTMLEEFETFGTAIPGNECLLLEPVWGDAKPAVGPTPAGSARGWPAHGDYFQGRLVLANFTLLPFRASASVVNAFYNFDDSLSDATVGYSVDAGVGGNDIIQDVVSTKSLVFTGFLGPSSTSLLLEVPTTSLNVFLNSQSNNGSSTVQANVINNQVLYVGRNRRTVYSMGTDVPDAGYTIINASALSQHLINQPVQSAVYNPSTNDGEYYLLVNGDGTLAVYQVLIEEQITAWTLGTTLGSYVDVATAGDQGWALCERLINTGALVSGPLGAAFLYTEEFYFQRNVTEQVNDAGLDVTLFAEPGQYVVFGASIKFDRLAVLLDTAASVDMDLSYEYLGESGLWEILAPIIDTTAGFTTDGVVSWEINQDGWTRQTLNKVENFYWIRVRRNAATGTPPLESQLLINTTTRIYIETLDFTGYVDSRFETITTTSGEVTVEHLAGQEVYAFVNGQPRGEYLVASDGTFNVGGTSVVPVSVGLDYKVEVTPMPIVMPLLRTGTKVYSPVFIKDAYIDFFESLALTVNGDPVQLLDMESVLVSPDNEPVTGVFDYTPYIGENPRAVITISQSYPAPMNLLGIGYRVKGAT